MELSRYLSFFILGLLLCTAGCLSRERTSAGRGRRNPEQSALSMIKASEGRLAPVYAPLAEQIGVDFDLSEKEGIGIDLGSGPGTLIIELCKRTQLHWINADIIVSRGSFHFWPDKTKAFSEIYRVLKPGGVAYIGRGFPRDLPVKTAEKIRASGKLKYDVEKTAHDLRRIMDSLKIKNYIVYRPKPSGGEHVNYGVWVEFHKPTEN